MHTGFLNRLGFALLALLLLCTGCGAKEPLPKPEYPLSEGEVAAALEEAGLSWRLTSTDSYTRYTDEKGARIIYSFTRPESGVDFQTGFIITSKIEGAGRYLRIIINEPQVAQWPEPAIPSWEHWKDQLVLAARLYGGFEDEEELYRACAAQALPMKEETLYEGALTGGYCRVSVTKLITDWRPSKANVVFFDLFESKAAYDQ